MFRAKAPGWGDNATDGPDLNSVIDYNYYAAGPQTSSVPQHITNGTASGYDGLQGWCEMMQCMEITIYPVRTGGDKDPMFVNFPFATNPLLDFAFDNSWNFHLKTGSRLLQELKQMSLLIFISTGVTVNGKTYKSPAPSAFFWCLRY